MSDGRGQRETYEQADAVLTRLRQRLKRIISDRNWKGRKAGLTQELGPRIGAVDEGEEIILWTHADVCHDWRGDCGKGDIVGLDAASDGQSPGIAGVDRSRDVGRNGSGI